MDGESRLRSKSPICLCSFSYFGASNRQVSLRTSSCIRGDKSKERFVGKREGCLAAQGASGEAHARELDAGGGTE